MMTPLELLRKQHPAQKNGSAQFSQNGVRMDVGADVHAGFITNKLAAGIKRGAAVFTMEPHADDAQMVANQFALIKALEEEGSRCDNNVYARELASSLRLKVRGLPTALVAAHGIEDVGLVGTGMKDAAGNVLAASSKASGGDSTTVYVEPTSSKFGQVVNELASAFASGDLRAWKTKMLPKGRQVRTYDGVDEKLLTAYQNDIHAQLRRTQDDAVAQLQPQIDQAVTIPSIASGIAYILGVVREKAWKQREEAYAMIRGSTIVEEGRVGGKHIKTVSILTPDTQNALRIMEESQRAGFEPDAITVTTGKRWFGR